MTKPPKQPRQKKKGKRKYLGNHSWIHKIKNLHHTDTFLGQQDFSQLFLVDTINSCCNLI